MRRLRDRQREAKQLAKEARRHRQKPPGQLHALRIWLRKTEIDQLGAGFETNANLDETIIPDEEWDRYVSEVAADLVRKGLKK
jgi:hypothetical protein